MNAADRAPSDPAPCAICHRPTVAPRALGDVKVCPWCAAGECRVDATHGLAYASVAALKQHYQAVHGISPQEAR